MTTYWTKNDEELIELAKHPEQPELVRVLAQRLEDALGDLETAETLKAKASIASEALLRQLGSYFGHAE